MNFLDNSLMFWPTDSHGNMEPDMKPFWHLGIVASSFVMLGESTENTLYNMAQVANVTQLVGRVFCCLLRNCDCRKTGTVYRAWSAFRCRLRTLKMTSFGADFFRDTNNLPRYWRIQQTGSWRFPPFVFFFSQPTENDQLKFDYHILLHDMVSQVTLYYHIKLFFIILISRAAAHNYFHHHPEQILKFIHL